MVKGRRWGTCSLRTFETNQKREGKEGAEVFQREEETIPHMSAYRRPLDQSDVEDVAGGIDQDMIDRWRMRVQCLDRTSTVSWGVFITHHASSPSRIALTLPPVLGSLQRSFFWLTAELSGDGSVEQRTFRPCWEALHPTQSSFTDLLVLLHYMKKFACTREKMINIANC